VDIYPDAAKIDKQFKYAEKRQIPFVIKDITDGMFALKNLKSGEQVSVDFNGLKEKLINFNSTTA
jgi:histidyl-tRNA synthetase